MYIMASLKQLFIAIGGKVDKYKNELLCVWRKALIQMTKVRSKVIGLRVALAVLRLP